jgi:hypothetical protein
VAGLSAQRMADEMESRLQALKGPLPDDPDRSSFFLAIAQGVVAHVVANNGAFTVEITGGPGTRTVSIAKRDP